MRKCGHTDTGRIPSHENQRLEWHVSKNAKDCQQQQQRKSWNRLPRHFGSARPYWSLILDFQSSLIYGPLLVQFWKYVDLYLTALSPTHQLPSSSALFPLQKYMTQNDGATTVQPTLMAHQDDQGQARECPSATQSTTRTSTSPGATLAPSLPAENSQAESKRTLVSKLRDVERVGR